jgi:hypothetical protein
MRSCCVLLVALLTLPPALSAQAPYAQIADIRIGGPLPAQWDYVPPDPASKRLSVSHNAEVVVIDTTADRVIGRIADTPGGHGIAIGRGNDPESFHVLVDERQ